MQKDVCSHTTLGGWNLHERTPFSCTLHKLHAFRNSWVLVNTSVSPPNVTMLPLTYVSKLIVCHLWHMWFAITDLYCSSLRWEYLARRKAEIKRWACFNIRKETNTLLNADLQTYQFKFDRSFSVIPLTYFWFSTKWMKLVLISVRGCLQPVRLNWILYLEIK